MSHDHVSYARANPDLGTTFAVGAGINIAYVLIEAGFGFYSGSLALLADAAHNLTDVAGLLLAWGAVSLGRRLPSDRHTYGFGRASILAALANGVALFAAVGALAWEAIQRFSAPIVVPGSIVLWIALLGIAVNAGTAALFIKGRKVRWHAPVSPPDRPHDGVAISKNLEIPLTRQLPHAIHGS